MKRAWIRRRRAHCGRGPNSALPHHVTGDTVICPGDVVVIDFGGENRGEGYIADTTRVFAVKRMPEGLQEIYDIVMGCQPGRL